MMEDLLACRVCLATSVNLYDMYKYKLKTLFEIYSGIQVSPADNYPQYLCSYCSTLLLKCAAFRDRSRKSQELMKYAEIKTGLLTTSQIHSIAVSNHTALPLSISTPEITTISDIYIKLEDPITLFKEELADQSDEEPLSFKVKKNNEQQIKLKKNKDTCVGEHIRTKKNMKSCSNKSGRIKRNKQACFVEQLVDMNKYEHVENNSETCLNEQRVEITCEKLKNNDETRDIELAEFKDACFDVEVPALDDSVMDFNDFDNIDFDFNSKIGENDEMEFPTSDIEVIFLSKEEQLQEILARKQSFNYINSFYKCEHCYKGFIQDGTYKNHMLRHDPSYGKETCDICKTRWPDVRSLKSHATSAHERKYICKLCDQVTKSSHRAKEHLKWHKGFKFICKICGASFSKSTSHLTHLRLHHPSKFCCEVCGESFLGEIGLNMHVKKAHRDVEKLNLKSQFKCTVCSIYFKCMDALKRHTNSFENGICDSSLSSCFQCGENVSSQELLREHMKTHDILVKCEECDRNFAHERSYAVHYQRVHLGIKLNHYKPKDKRKKSAWVCEICGKKCVSNAALVYHQRTHTGEKPYQCKECPKKFSIYQRLQIHLRTHTGERPFKCSTCPKAFKHKAALNRHDRVHSGAKPYQCNHCGKAFSQSNSMKLHVRTVHLKMPAPYRSRRTGAIGAIGASVTELLEN